MIESEIRDWLVDNVPTCGGRVRPSYRPPSEEEPSLTYSRITGSRDYTHCGKSGLASGTFQVDCWAQSYVTAKEMTLEVVEIGGYQGGNIAGAWVESESDTYYQDTGWFQIAIDIRVNYQEREEEENNE